MLPVVLIPISFASLAPVTASVVFAVVTFASVILFVTRYLQVYLHLLYHHLVFQLKEVHPLQE